MDQIELTLEKRDVTGKKVKQLRVQGIVPAVVYGHHFDPLTVQVEEKALRQAVREAGTSRLIDLKIPGFMSTEKALIRDLLRDPISRDILHVDFYRVSMTERITAEIPIAFVGESPALGNSMFMLYYGLESVQVECLPGDLPESIEADLSALRDAGDAMYVRDLAVPDKVTILTDPEELVVRVEETKAGTLEEEELVGAEAGEPEVISSRKEREGEGTSGED